MAVTIVLEEEPYRLITDGDEHYAVIEARDGLVYSLHSHDRQEAADTAEGMAEVVGDGWCKPGMARDTLQPDALVSGTVRPLFAEVEGASWIYLDAHWRASRMSLLLNYLETLSLLISNSTIRAAGSIRPNNSSGKFYWSRCGVWSPML
jgi:hypothetical protein